MNKHNNIYVNRELSWLQFNARVLQEAEDSTVPLIERLRFLGIFSNNLDEFFRVRYAKIQRSVEEDRKINPNESIESQQILNKITEEVIKLQARTLQILNTVETELEKENIHLINETEVDDAQRKFLRKYFLKNVSPSLVTIVLDDNVELPSLKDSAAYLGVKMTFSEKPNRYALVEISKNMKRFVVLPKQGNDNYIIMVDDVIRLCLKDIFNIFNFDSITAHMLKITRDAELDLESDLSKSFMEKISDSVKERQEGEPIRFVYDKSIDKSTLKYFMDKMRIDSGDSQIPGGRYHNRKDYMGFPSLGRKDLLYPKIDPLSIKGLGFARSIIKAIKEKDYLLYTPYQTFDYVVKFLREAAIDPKVTSIKITIYRLARNSQVASALINAAKNGKEVIVSMEIQARFDEEANIEYAQEMQRAGVKLIFGVKGLKVHSKMCVVDRLEKGKNKRYGFVSTGNFNESTAKIYTDFTLFTANQKILKDLNKVFSFFQVNYKVYRYKHIIASPHYTKNAFNKLIDQEIANKKEGKPAYIQLKMNSLSSYKMIDKLYEASRAGVKVQMIVRGICCLVPGVKGMSENIEVISVIDKFLEHTRVYMFCNNNDPKVYISSADWMTRNIENRVEVTCPIYDESIKQEMINLFDICWNDNVKSRILNEEGDNVYISNNKTETRSQFEAYRYLENQLKE